MIHRPSDPNPSLGPARWAGRPPAKLAFQTPFGRMVLGKAEVLLQESWVKKLRQKVNLVLTSPPFPLNRKKKYGNLVGTEYLDWLSSLAEPIRDMITEDGSIVLELGNAWVPGLPTMSTLAIESLLRFKEKAGLHLCQEFIWFNPAKLPTPAQWVTVERIRVKDSFTRFWWLSKSPRPKADNRNVLQTYSRAMRNLIDKQKYNAGKRPSEHVIGEESFLKDHGGSIAPNVLMPSNLLTWSNTSNADGYLEFCREIGTPYHPARMPLEVARFFVEFLTDSEDLVLDPFCGSCTSGKAAEDLGRRWVGFEVDPSYAGGARGRFEKVTCVNDRILGPKERGDLG